MTPSPNLSYARIFLAAAVVAAALTLAACGSGGNGAGNPDSNLSAEQASEPLPAGAPPQLVAIRDEANQLLDGGTDAFEARLEELRGTPVVVNKWASWCGPCRLEFPYFQSQAQKRGGEIAFLGVDANIVRLVLAVFTVFGGAGVALYVIAWLLIPDEGAATSIAEDLFKKAQDNPNVQDAVQRTKDAVNKNRTHA